MKNKLSQSLRLQIKKYYSDDIDNLISVDAFDFLDDLSALHLLFAHTNFLNNLVLFRWDSRNDEKKIFIKLLDECQKNKCENIFYIDKNGYNLLEYYIIYSHEEINKYLFDKYHYNIDFVDLNKDMIKDHYLFKNIKKLTLFDAVLHSFDIDSIKRLAMVKGNFHPRKEKSALSTFFINDLIPESMVLKNESEDFILSVVEFFDWHLLNNKELEDLFSHFKIYNCSKSIEKIEKLITLKTLELI